MSIRLAVLGLLILLALLGLGWRAYDLQVYEAANFMTRAEENRTRVEGVPAPRGRFLDRSDRVLAENRTSVDVLLVDPRFTPEGAARERLSWVLGTPLNELMRKLPKRRTAGYYLPILLREEVGDRTYVRLLEDRIHLPSIVPREILVRHYPFESLACHLFGRVGRIGADDRDKYLALGYMPDAAIGTAGLERQFEPELRGQNGIRTMNVDALGWPVGAPRQVEEPVPGKDIKLSLDLNIQLGIERALGSHRGSITVVDPRTGDILGLASFPRFDPNHFNRKVSAEEWERLAKSEWAPLLDRATEAAYSPGSTFKVVVSMAALQAGVDPNETVVCNGRFQIGERFAKCWKKGGHGPMTMIPALAHSCNVYFYTMGLRAGIERITEIAGQAGLGRKSDIGVGGEKPGVIPGPAWRKEHRGSVWTLGDTVNVAIGQGEVLVTPLQMARLMGAIENGGLLMKPRLVQAIGSKEPRIEFPPQEDSRIKLSTKDREVVLDGMRLAVSGGTAALTKIKGLEIYGKTGSAQNPAGETHAWFMGVMRAPGGSVALAVCLENAGTGGHSAAPVAKEVFQAILDAGWDHPGGAAPVEPTPAVDLGTAIAPIDDDQEDATTSPTAESISIFAPTTPGEPEVVPTAPVAPEAVRAPEPRPAAPRERRRRNRTAAVPPPTPPGEIPPQPPPRHEDQVGEGLPRRRRRHRSEDQVPAEVPPGFVDPAQAPAGAAGPDSLGEALYR